MNEQKVRELIARWNVQCSDFLTNAKAVSDEDEYTAYMRHAAIVAGHIRELEAALVPTAVSKEEWAAFTVMVRSGDYTGLVAKVLSESERKGRNK